MKQSKIMTLLLAGGTDGIGRSFLDKYMSHFPNDTYYVLGRTNRDLPSNVKFIQHDITSRDVLQLDFKIDTLVFTIGSFTKNNDQIEEHFNLNSVCSIKFIENVVKYMSNNAQMLIVTSALCSGPARPEYSVQGATKIALQYYIDSIRGKYPAMRVMTIQPSGLQTDIFQKGGDNRDTSHYPKPEVVTDVMIFQLKLPREISIDNVLITNKPHK